MKKVLFTATVDSHILHFHTPYLQYFKDEGFEVHVATNGSEEIPFCDVKHVIRFERNPIKPNNLKAIRELRKIIDKEKFDIIHTHTPMGGVVTRLAAINARKKGTKVIYTAHGFHFYKGAPLINWLMYYPIEKLLSYHTDCLITINKEDYELALKKMKAKEIKNINGVGVDIEKTKKTKVDIKLKRKELGVPEKAFVILSVGELNKNKNHEIVIKALSELNNSKIHYIICGQGNLESYLKELINKLGLEKQVHLLGYRNDVAEIYKVSNIFIFPSKREGLPVSLMEAMSCGLPVICSNVRGNRDLVQSKKNGFLLYPNDINGFCKSIDKLIFDKQLIKSIGENNRNQMEKYSINNVMSEMKNIYFI